MSSDVFFAATPFSTCQVRSGHYVKVKPTPLPKPKLLASKTRHVDLIWTSSGPHLKNLQNTDDCIFNVLL